jgi:hypothetical protein
MNGLHVALGLGLVALATGACGPSGELAQQSHTDRVSSAIIHGTDSDPSEDAVVLVMHYDAIQIGGAAAGCSGTLLTPRLVLTARHCVATTDESAACDSAGTPTFGGAISGDHLAAKMYAFVGPQRPDFLTGLDKGARGVEIIDDASKTLCNHDLALVLLDRALPGARTSAVRLEGGPRAEETVRVVGWGVTERSPNPETRQHRGGVKVLAVGPADALGPSEFKLGESGCAGDSGGPAFAESTGALLGVLSRGGNGSGATPGDPAACLGAENVFTSAAAFKDLIVGAYAKAGQDPWREGEPDPTTLPPRAPAADGTSGCAVAPSHAATPASFALVLALAAVAACVSRRVTRS